MLDFFKKFFNDEKKEKNTKFKREIILKIRKLDKNKSFEELIKLDIEELKQLYINLKIQREANMTKYTIPEPSKPVIEIDKRTKDAQSRKKDDIKNTEKENQFNKTYNKKRSNYAKGVEYEKFVAKHFEQLGYIIKFNGIENKKKDNSIDLIAIKKNEIILIQCKNWNAKNGYRINHKDIKAFIGDTLFFIEENPQYKNYNIKRLFVISDKILDKSAINYINEHKDKIRYLLLPFSNNKTT